MYNSGLTGASAPGLTVDNREVPIPKPHDQAYYLEHD